MRADIEVGYLFGVDPGKLGDPTALVGIHHRQEVQVIDERDRQRALEAVMTGRPVPSELTGGWQSWSASLPHLGDVKARRSIFEVVFIERVPLQTSYPAMVDMVADILDRAPLRGRTTLVVDKTGVGEPVMDLMKTKGLRPRGVTITGGGRATRSRGDYHVSKVHLVDMMAVLLQTGRLRIARDLQHAQSLVDELLNFEAHTTAAGNTTFGARIGAHDDIVLACACACFVGSRMTSQSDHGFHTTLRRG